MDFPGGPVDKNLPSNAGDAGLIPCQGTKISHASGQLSPCTATRAQAPQEKPLCVQLDKAHALQVRASAAKK